MSSYMIYYKSQANYIGVYTRLLVREILEALLMLRVLRILMNVNPDASFIPLYPEFNSSCLTVDDGHTLDPSYGSRCTS